jgi:ethanolamine transporter EutH
MFLHDAVLALCALTLASVGILAAFPVFWSIPSAFLAGTAATQAASPSSTPSATWPALWRPT